MAISRAQRARVLIVGDDARATDPLRAALQPAWTCEVAAGQAAGLAAFAHGEYDVVVSDARWDDPTRSDLLDAVHRRTPEVPLVSVGDVGEIIGSSHGDAVVTRGDPAALVAFVQRALAERDRRRDDAAGAPIVDPVLIGAAPSFLAMLEAVDQVAQASAPVLLIGETGTGKDVIASRIHARGPRRHRPYVVVNAGAITSSLLDSELFGHVAGAFTGATRPRRGLIMEADGGTLFLDEIVDLPIELQGRLLRVIESGTVRAVGADHERRVDVRFIAATHRDLAVAVREGRFREDLFYRLDVLAIRVPPLRERREDIAPLARYFFDRARARNPRSPVTEIGPEVEAELERAGWPGNVRQLATLVERWVVFSNRGRIDVGDMPAATPVSPAQEKWSVDEMCTLRALSTRYVEWVLGRTDGDKARAAAILGIDVSTLYRWQRRRPDE